MYGIFKAIGLDETGDVLFFTDVSDLLTGCPLYILDVSTGLNNNSTFPDEDLHLTQAELKTYVVNNFILNENYFNYFFII